MLNVGKFTSSLQNRLWVEAAQIVTVLQNNLVAQQGAMSPCYQSLGREEQVSCIEFDLVKYVFLPMVLSL